MSNESPPKNQLTDVDATCVQVGVLALSVFPIIFVTVPQGSSSVLAASYSLAAAETIDPWQLQAVTS